MDAPPFSPEGVVWEYRFAYEVGYANMGNVTAEFPYYPNACEMLSSVWKEWQGEDSLHEMAYGEPISADALADRQKRVREWLETGRPKQLQAVRAQLAWLDTVETV